VLLGCGVDSAEDQASDAALAWADALADEDYAGACEFQDVDASQRICEATNKQYASS